MKKLFALLLLIISLFMLFACKKNEIDNSTLDNSIDEKSNNEPSEQDNNVSIEKRKYTITYDFDGGVCKEVLYEFVEGSKYKLPTPDKEGYVFLGWYEGEKKIEYTYENRNYNVRAKWKYDNAPKTITISGKDSVFVGSAYSIQLTVDITPSTANKEVTWQSNNEKVAIIDDNGLLTGISEGVVRIRAISKEDPLLASEYFTVIVKEKRLVEPVDLKGYEIVLMNAESALGDIDPFLDSYTKNDKIYKQEAWREVEKNFNCKITAKAYPALYFWGGSNINYLIQNAKDNTSECDLAVVSTRWIYDFAFENEDAAVDVSSYYEKYGENKMNNILKEAGSYKGKLYIASTGIDESENNVNFGLYYNIALLESIKIESPAKMFNEGRWTYSNFRDWTEKASSLLGKGKYVLSGHPYYWWFGLSNAAGIKVADATTLQVNLLTQRQKDATSLYKDLYQAGYVDTVPSWCESGIDGNAWFNGNALLTTGYFWFVNNENRWSSKFLGEDTRYGYVPFPYPDDLSKDDTRISHNALVALLYVKGRQYPTGVTTEGVYQAVNEMFLSTLQKKRIDPEFDANLALENTIKSGITDSDSIEAMKYFDLSKVFYDSTQVIYPYVTSCPLTDACVKVMMEGEDYDSIFTQTEALFVLEFNKYYG